MFLTNHAHNAEAYPSLPLLHRQVIDLLFTTLCRIMLQYYTKSSSKNLCAVVLLWSPQVHFLGVCVARESSR